MGWRMEDYIDILLNEMEEHWADFLDGTYFLQRNREIHAERALRETLSKAQSELFLSYEEQRNAAEVLRERAITRRAFLLAREIYG